MNDSVWYRNKVAYIKKWSKANTKRWCLSLNRNYDKEIIEYLESLPNATSWVKELIRKEIKNTK